MTSALLRELPLAIRRSVATGLLGKGEEPTVSPRVPAYPELRYMGSRRKVEDLSEVNQVVLS